MRSIDVHFHVVPPRFVDAVRRGEFADTVELVRDRGADRMTYHAPPDVVLEPGTTLLPHLHDEGLILEALDRRGLDAAAVGLSPEEFYYWAPPAVGARIAAIQNDGMAELVRSHADRFVHLGHLTS